MTAFYCGIDQGKLKSDLCVIDGGKRVLARARIDSNSKDLLAFLERFGKDVHCVVESSATWYWLVDCLQEAGYRVTMAHPLKLAMITRAKVKTDRRDAQLLAEMLLGGFIPPSYIYPKEQRSLRDLARHRSDLVRKRAMEFISLKLLAARHGYDSWRRGELKYISEEMIEDVFDDNELLRLHGVGNVEIINLLTRQIEELEAAILKRIGNMKLFMGLNAIPGIGKALAIVIYLEICDIQRFKSVRAFSSYCRVIPGVAQSGASSRRGRGSKQGNPHLKSALSQAAVAAVRCYPHIKSDFEGHLEKRQAKGGKMVCYNIIAHKLALAVYHVMHGEAYDSSKLFQAA